MRRVIAILLPINPAMLAAGDPAPAIPALERAVALNPESGLAHLLLATAIFNVRGNPDQVVAHARRAVTLHPTDMEALLLLARALGVRGDLAEGRTVITRALSLDPAHVEVTELLATFRKAMDARIR